MELDKANMTRTENMPMLALRGISVFPGMLMNFDVERPMSVAALNAAIAGNQIVFLVAQRDISCDLPQPEDLYGVGTICRVKQLLRVPGGTSVRVMVEGLGRGRMAGVTSEIPCYRANVDPLNDEPVRDSDKTEALVRQSYTLFDDYAQLSGTVAPESILNIIANPEPGHVADYITQNIYLKHTEKQLILEELSPVRRLTLINRFLSREINILGIEQGLAERTQEQMAKSQRDYYLREHLKVIQSELGEGEDVQSELDEYRRAIMTGGLPEEVSAKLLKELGRLQKQPFGSSEASVIRSYLDVCLELPWTKHTKEQLDIEKARKVLDADHFGLEKVKDRIIEYLAVRKLAPGLKGGVICLVGPPGVGKTSIAMSVARATNRKLARLSLGGVHDEAEIRGHRKTYVGAMPGRIINAVNQAKSRNPLLVLDEIDKLGHDYRGDPSAALLEALDPEVNGSFRDHYLELPFDLSEVFFITTANTTETIPRPLLDRMELIEIGSYTDEEKLSIAKRHLLPKQRKKHGLNGGHLKLSDDAIREIISTYTRESGVRVLERRIAALCRKTAGEVAGERIKSLRLKAGMLVPYLGAPKYKPGLKSAGDEIGLAHGLAWTAVGGEVLDVEAGVLEGTGKLELTGNLGSVMKESASAAITYIRSRAGKLGVDPEFHKTKDIHIHFPEGAVPKDGPSAGITMAIAVISALTGIPVRRDIAMTGEITLRGRVLAIGGLREKTMAALREGINTVIVPQENESDLHEIDPAVRSALNFITADHIDKILDSALARPAALEPVGEAMPENPHAIVQKLDLRQ